MTARRLFVTTALPYANGSFHIGHIMEYIQADIWVRWQRMRGHEVHFVGADDAHGAPIMLKAENEGVTPQQLVARIAAERPTYLRGFHIAFDHWHSTDSPENVELSQGIYLALREAGLIDTRTVEQFFDPVKGMFLPDRFIKGECPRCGAKDQYGDACEVCGAVYEATELKNPYSTLTGATPQFDGAAVPFGTRVVDVDTGAYDEHMHYFSDKSMRHHRELRDAAGRNNDFRRAAEEPVLDLAKVAARLNNSRPALDLRDRIRRDDRSGWNRLSLADLWPEERTY